MVLTLARKYLSLTINAFSAQFVRSRKVLTSYFQSALEGTFICVIGCIKHEWMKTRHWSGLALLQCYRQTSSLKTVHRLFT